MSGSRSMRRYWWSVLAAMLFFGALIGAAPRVWRAEGTSMAEAAHSGDRVLTLRPSLVGVAPGDLVIARVRGVAVLKRVAAVGPASVHVDAAGRLAAAAEAACGERRGCTEELLGAHRYTVHFTARLPAQTHEVPADHVFVLGDARDVSRDSRDYGPIPMRDVLGRVVWR